MELAQAVDDPPPGVAAIGLGQRAGRVLNGVEQVGDSGMVGLQAVHDWADRGVAARSAGNSSTSSAPW